MGSKQKGNRRRDLMEKQKCKGCIWLDNCLNKTEDDERCADYFDNDEASLIRQLSIARREYQKEWDVYVQDTE